ncbi:MAG: SDR family oxidoreductase [Gemmatimonadota bacterium]|nr:SDR family oxidoreductase [Gemmatimonadota bacterium]
MTETTTLRTAVVTGASRGIGLAIARALAAAGMRVAMIARGAEPLAARAAEIGPTAIAIASDVGNVQTAHAGVERIVQAFGGTPDILVNNAGLFAMAPIAELAPAEFVESLEANLIGPFVLVNAFLAGMRERGSGHIVTIGSIADRAIFPGNAAYAASKFGVRALHEVLRAETRGTGIRATLVSPGPTDTTLWDAHDPDTTPGLTPRAAMLRAESVAEAVMFAVTRPPATNIDELRLSPA